MKINKSTKILVLCGGFSSERKISLQSGNSVYKCLIDNGYLNSIILDISSADDLIKIIKIHPDVVFLALHGKGGEDGRIQGFLDLAKIPYTGSSCESSALCMNKILTKILLKANNLPTPNFVVYTKDKNLDDFIENVNNYIKFPCVVKSPREGSSIGVYLVDNRSEMKNAIEDALKLDDSLFIEEYIDGVEITLPIIKDEKIKALPIIEITSENTFYDYESKYTKGLCKHICPANISEEVKSQVDKVGISAFKCLNCKGILRVDFIIDKFRGPLIIEANTLPGLTPMSLFPDSASKCGISFITLIEKILLSV